MNGRVIKYRAYLKEDSEVTVGDDTVILKKGFYEITGLHWFGEYPHFGKEVTSISINSEFGEIQDIWLEVIPFELMEFIGLKDKNNQEIYDCDFVKHGGSIWLVDHSYNGFFIKGLNMDSSVDVFEDCEVIGNKFENLEYLKED